VTIPNDTTGRPPASPGVLVIFPVIEIRGDWLIWDSSGESKEKAPPRNLLERFSDLHQADDEAILKFARSSGPLGHCMHGRLHCCPIWHQIDSRLGADSIAGWRRLSTAVAALSKIAARVAVGQPGRRVDWQTIGQVPWLTSEEPWHTLQGSRFQLKREVNAWLDAGNVRPYLNSRGHRWEISMRAAHFPPLFGELALQMVMAATNIDGFALCDGCANTFIPDRRPNPNRRRYCAECQHKKFPQRDAKREFWRRANLAKTLAGKE
jgi:hypothetical protein